MAVERELVRKMVVVLFEIKRKRNKGKMEMKNDGMTLDELKTRIEEP